VFQENDRGRLVVAAALTVAALPFLWDSKQQESGGEAVAAIGAGASGAVISPAPAPAESAAIGTPAFLSSPEADSTAGNDVVTIDVAPGSTGNTVSGSASYRRFDDDILDSDRPCGTPLAPFGARVVVTHTDNGFRIACTNVQTKQLSDEIVLVLDTDAFLELADLGDSPIPVQISW
jgi:hypothetical protein